MNCVEPFLRHARQAPQVTAIWVAGGRRVTFGELLAEAGRAQARYRQCKVGPGDSVLFMHPLDPALYANLIAVLALGARVVLVEPWMPVEKVEGILQQLRPRAFFSSWKGKLWGARVKAVRQIPHWFSPGFSASGGASGPKDLHVESVPAEQDGILTFTSGSTGLPKGVVRRQGYLLEQHRVLCRNLHLDSFRENDLCIFANFALANLTSGRGSILMPPGWKNSDFRWLSSLPTAERPASLTCGPAFLARLLETGAGASLRSIHVGGALADCDFYAKVTSALPDAEALQIYGSTEVEPVALISLPEAVRRSRASGFFHALTLGHPIPEIEHETLRDELWVTGPHVCPEYFGNSEENRIYKRRDGQGRVWHNLGDRITEKDGAWIYSGRSQQSSALFWLEQKVYHALGHSRAFLHQEKDRVIAVGEDVVRKKTELKALAPEIEGFAQARIVRDRRHQARIDRVATLKGASQVSS